MHMLIKLKYQKWLLIIPLMLVSLAAVINYLYNTRILRIFEIMILYVFTGFVIMCLWSNLSEYSFFSGVWFFWVLFYLIGTPVGLYIISLQEKDFNSTGRHIF